MKVTQDRVPASAKLQARRIGAGLLFRWGSLWIGLHWSPANRRICINLVPCVTVWIVLKGGIRP